MRILTPAEVREVERIRREIKEADYIEIHGKMLEIVPLSEHREFWLNVLDMALQANEAMLLAWRRSQNPNVNLVEMVMKNE